MSRAEQIANIQNHYQRRNQINRIMNHYQNIPIQAVEDQLINQVRTTQNLDTTRENIPSIQSTFNAEKQNQNKNQRVNQRNYWRVNKKFKGKKPNQPKVKTPKTPKNKEILVEEGPQNKPEKKKKKEAKIPIAEKVQKIKNEVEKKKKKNKKTKNNPNPDSSGDDPRNSPKKAIKNTLRHANNNQPDDLEKQWKGYAGDTLSKLGDNLMKKDETVPFGLLSYLASMGMNYLQGIDTKKRKNKKKQKDRFEQNEAERKEKQAVNLVRATQVLQKRYQDYMLWRNKTIKDIGLMEAERQGNTKTQVEQVKRDYKMHDWQQKIQKVYNPLIAKSQSSNYEKYEKEKERVKLGINKQQLDEGKSGWLQYKMEYHDPNKYKPKNGIMTMTTQALGNYAMKKLMDLSLRNNISAYYKVPLKFEDFGINVQKVLGLKFNEECLREINSADVSWVMHAGRIASHLAKLNAKSNWWKKAIGFGLDATKTIANLVSIASPLHPLISTLTDLYSKYISPWNESYAYKTIDQFSKVKEYVEKAENVLGTQGEIVEWGGTTLWNWLNGNQMGFNYEPFLRDREVNWIKDRQNEKKEAEILLQGRVMGEKTNKVIENLKKFKSRDGIMNALREAKKAEEMGRFHKERRFVPEWVKEGKEGVINGHKIRQEEFKEVNNLYGNILSKLKSKAGPVPKIFSDNYNEMINYLKDNAYKGLLCYKLSELDKNRYVVIWKHNMDLAKKFTDFNDEAQQHWYNMSSTFEKIIQELNTSYKHTGNWSQQNDKFKELNDFLYWYCNKKTENDFPKKQPGYNFQNFFDKGSFSYWKNSAFEMTFSGPADKRHDLKWNSYKLWKELNDDYTGKNIDWKIYLNKFNEYFTVEGPKNPLKDQLLDYLKNKPDDPFYKYKELVIYKDYSKIPRMVVDDLTKADYNKLGLNAKQEERLNKVIKDLDPDNKEKIKDFYDNYKFHFKRMHEVDHLDETISNTDRELFKQRNLNTWDPNPPASTAPKESPTTTNTDNTDEETQSMNFLFNLINGEISDNDMVSTSKLSHDDWRSVLFHYFVHKSKIAEDILRNNGFIGEVEEEVPLKKISGSGEATETVKKEINLFDVLQERMQQARNYAIITCDYDPAKPYDTSKINPDPNKTYQDIISKNLIIDKATWDRMYVQPVEEHFKEQKFKTTQDGFIALNKMVENVGKLKEISQISDTEYLEGKKAWSATREGSQKRLEEALMSAYNPDYKQDDLDNLTKVKRDPAYWKADLNRNYVLQLVLTTFSEWGFPDYDVFMKTLGDDHVKQCVLDKTGNSIFGVAFYKGKTEQERIVKFNEAINRAKYFFKVLKDKYAISGANIKHSVMLGDYHYLNSRNPFINTESEDKCNRNRILNENWGSGRTEIPDDIKKLTTMEGYKTFKQIQDEEDERLVPLPPFKPKPLMPDDFDYSDFKLTHREKLRWNRGEYVLYFSNDFGEKFQVYYLTENGNSLTAEWFNKNSKGCVEGRPHDVNQYKQLGFPPFEEFKHLNTMWKIINENYRKEDFLRTPQVIENYTGKAMDNQDQIQVGQTLRDFPKYVPIWQASMMQKYKIPALLNNNIDVSKLTGSTYPIKHPLLMDTELNNFIVKPYKEQYSYYTQSPFYYKDKMDPSWEFSVHDQVLAHDIHSIIKADINNPRSPFRCKYPFGGHDYQVLLKEGDTEEDLIFNNQQTIQFDDYLKHELYKEAPPRIKRLLNHRYLYDKQYDPKFKPIFPVNKNLEDFHYNNFLESEWFKFNIKAKDKRVQYDPVNDATNQEAKANFEAFWTKLNKEFCSSRYLDNGIPKGLALYIYNHGQGRVPSRHEVFDYLHKPKKKPPYILWRDSPPVEEPKPGMAKSPFKGLLPPRACGKASYVDLMEIGTLKDKIDFTLKKEETGIKQTINTNNKHPVNALYSISAKKWISNLMKTYGADAQALFTSIPNLYLLSFTDIATIEKILNDGVNKGNLSFYTHLGNLYHKKTMDRNYAMAKSVLRDTQEAIGGLDPLFYNFIEENCQEDQKVCPFIVHNYNKIMNYKRKPYKLTRLLYEEGAIDTSGLRNHLAYPKQLDYNELIRLSPGTIQRIKEDNKEIDKIEIITNDEKEIVFKSEKFNRGYPYVIIKNTTLDVKKNIVIDNKLIPRDPTLYKQNRPEDDIKETYNINEIQITKLTSEDKPKDKPYIPKLQNVRSTLTPNHLSMEQGWIPLQTPWGNKSAFEIPPYDPRDYEKPDNPDQTTHEFDPVFIPKPVYTYVEEKPEPIIPEMKIKFTKPEEEMEEQINVEYDIRNEQPVKYTPEFVPRYSLK